MLKYGRLLFVGRPPEVVIRTVAFLPSGVA
jgi:hypothetical protein